MGNQITATAPAQILPLESYFNELPEYTKSTSLGGTRFFKVAKAKHSDGSEVVIKVFAKHDLLLQLAPYEKKLHDQLIRLHGVCNALPFKKFHETDKAAYLVRQHLQYNLYDRLSTRPLLTVMEKKWIVFQLLKALDECRDKKISHGDIKTENVLLTSWGWVLLTDFASFKPTLLPDNNPADFSFFFDTSRRRTCYIAPERFQPFQELATTGSLSGRSQVLTHGMDIFSLGCVIGELFLDGKPMFDLSQLLRYSSGEKEFSENTLKRISDKFIRRMVLHMTKLDPAERFTAQEYLHVYKGDVFPEYFYSFLHDYFKHFCINSQLTPDQCIQKLFGDIDAILANLILHTHKQDRETGYGDALVIVLSAITSHLRLAQFVVSKLQALEMIRSISHHIPDEAILERVIPYLVYIVKDKWASVRATAVTVLSHCLSLISHLPRSDYNLFLEYVLPSLNSIPSDPDVMVRVAFAECVAELALTALRFLELAQVQANQDDDSAIIQYQVQGSYDSELMQLQESFQGKIVHLLSDADTSVKKAFLKYSAGKLCTFFGPHRAKEVILSHMITFLNDKTDWELHGAFFECIVDVVTHLRHHSLSILEPLLQQGLSDCEETVVCKTIEAMTTLCREQVFDKPTLLEYVSGLAPFLVHPNIWLRYGAVGFMIAVAGQLDSVDVECYVLPKIHPFLRLPVIQIQEVCILLSVLRDPVPRGVFDYLLKQQNIREIFECLTGRRVTRTMTHRDQEPNYVTIGGNLIPTFKKLQSLGLDEEQEVNLIALKDHMLKQHLSKKQFPDLESRYTSTRGVLDTKKFPGAALTPKYQDLVYENSLPPPLVSSAKKKTAAKGTTTAAVLSDKDSAVNEEWDRIFGSPPKPSTPSPVKSDGRGRGGSSPRSPRKISNPLSSSSDTTILLNTAERDETRSIGPPEKSMTAKPNTLSPLLKGKRGHKRSKSDGAIHKLDTKTPVEKKVSRSREISPDSIESSIVKVEYARCKENLTELLKFKQRQYVEDMRAMDNDLAKNASFQSTPGWVPKGQLIAHIHEHKHSINRLSVMTDSTMFATFSDDGSTKLWDVAKLEGRNIVNKAKLSYSQQGGKIKVGIFCQSNRSIAAASSNGTVHVFNLESVKVGGVIKRKLTHDMQLDPGNYGHVVDMATFTAGGQNVLCLATNAGKLCGMDLRTNKLAWDLTNNSKYGLTLSMAVDPFENWVALGTSLGYHVIWDMRFQLPISHWQHSGHGKAHVHHVYRLSAHPTQPSSLVSAVSGNNEVSVWDMETATRRQMLWASPAQPFGEMTDNPQQHECVRALSTCLIDNCPVVVTGGTDRTVRLWNLVDPALCSCVISPRLHSKKIHFDYKSRIIEGVDVFKEVLITTAGNLSSSTTSSNPTHHTSNVLSESSSHMHSHVDFITDLAVVPYKNQQFIVSSSHDGVLKIWK
ncbi:phosphoinositide 3-kinase regulatory subunit 4-like [Halichondria panicea]|uniref:phosphoinositide 3-kinase regulatory subunit 4-like n=1 Tax=Halichondria panicea TaxID=6063 RepID=UPI00312B7ED5